MTTIYNPVAICDQANILIKGIPHNTVAECKHLFCSILAVDRCTFNCPGRNNKLIPFKVFWKSVSLVWEAVNGSRLTFIHYAACSQHSQLYSSIKTVIIEFFSPMKLPLIWHFWTQSPMFPPSVPHKWGKRACLMWEIIVLVLIYIYWCCYSTVWYFFVLSLGIRPTPLFWELKIFF